MAKPPPKNAYNKAMFDLPAPEKLIPGENYALTINPKVSITMHGFDIKNLDDQYAAICNILLTISEYCTYDCFLELSKMGKLHLHATIKIYKRDVFGFYAWCVPYLAGHCTFTIKPMKEAIVDCDYKSWDEYCKKGKEYMKEPLQERFMKWNISNVDIENMQKKECDKKGIKQWNKWIPRNWIHNGIGIKEYHYGHDAFSDTEEK